MHRTRGTCQTSRSTSGDQRFPRDRKTQLHLKGWGDIPQVDKAGENIPSGGICIQASKGPREHRTLPGTLGAGLLKSNNVLEAPRTL